MCLQWALGHHKDKSLSRICTLKVDLAKSIIELLSGTLSAPKQSAILFLWDERERQAISNRTIRLVSGSRNKNKKIKSENEQNLFFKGIEMRGFPDI